MRFVKIVLGTIVVGLLSVQMASAEMAAPKLSGFIDTTYNQKISGTKTTPNFGRSFDVTPNTFLLNTVHLNVDGSAGPAGYHIELDFGPDATTAGAATNNIQEAYMTWSMSGHMEGQKCWLTVGKFVTLEGIEVIESGMNPTISRGYLFGLAEPFSHTGVKMDHTVMNGKFQFTLGAVNGWDTATSTGVPAVAVADTDNNRDKTYLGRIGFNGGDPLTVGLVYYTGPEGGSDKRTSIDITGVSKWGPLAINFQYNVGDEEVAGTTEKWSGFGIQPVYTITDKFSVGARYEYFNDKDSGVGRNLGAKDAWNFTLTPTWKLSDAVTVRAEYRLDNFTPKVGGTSEDYSTVGAEMIYTF